MKEEQAKQDKLSYLDEENIARSGQGVEYHPLKPFLPKGTRVLYLGSFPPPRKRWCMDFFYPNWINDHWRIEGEVFFGDKDYFVDAEHKTFRLAELVPFLEEKGIGFFDTATAVRRLKDNASDAFLEVVEPTDLRALMARVPECRVIVTTGGKAAETLCATLGISEVPALGQHVPIPAEALGREGVVLYRLPSSSRAFPMKLAQKAAYYREMYLMLPT